MAEMIGKSLGELLPAQFVFNENDDTWLVRRMTQLSRKPVIQFTNAELGIVIRQRVGLEYVIPIAIDRLSENPFLKAEYYFGDLLSAVLGVSEGFWKSHQDQYWMMLELASGLPIIVEQLDSEIREFLIF